MSGQATTNPSNREIIDLTSPVSTVEEAALSPMAFGRRPQLPTGKLSESCRATLLEAQARQLRVSKELASIADDLESCAAARGTEPGARRGMISMTYDVFEGHERAELVSMAAAARSWARALHGHAQTTQNAASKGHRAPTVS